MCWPSCPAWPCPWSCCSSVSSTPQGSSLSTPKVRRQKARAAKAAEVSSSSSAGLADEASDPFNTEQVDKTEKLKEKDSAEQAYFQCNICDFESNWENGLNVHMSRKHANIEQLDGCDSFDDELDEKDKYMKTLH